MLSNKPMQSDGAAHFHLVFIVFDRSLVATIGIVDDP
jgi:hypothetical protein